jgi:pyruvate/2-oxoglutarate dehydrogenase complex dihydrolipoamide acyltransferase (E2) component
VAYEFKLPDLGEGLTEGEIARWLVTEGQEVAEDDPLVEIQTDKTTVEIPSPAAGKVAQILAREGEVVPVGTVIVVIGDGAPARTPDEQPRAAPAQPTPAFTGSDPGTNRPQVRATPLVRRLAQELGVELEPLAGSGPQ